MNTEEKKNHGFMASLKSFMSKLFKSKNPALLAEKNSTNVKKVGAAAFLSSVLVGTGATLSQTKVLDNEKPQVQNNTFVESSLTPEISNYSKVEITDEDISTLTDYIHSWENTPLYSYIQGDGDYTFDNTYISNYITEDKKYFICTNYDDYKTYGFGTMVNAHGEPNQPICKMFKELGYDLTDPRYLQDGISKLPVEAVNKVSQNLLKKNVEKIQDCLYEKNVNFTKNEILALASICYQYGNYDLFINHFIDSYVEYGGNTNEFKENCQSTAGTSIFYSDIGASTNYNGKTIKKSESYWNAFHNNEFIMGSGKEAIHFSDTKVQEQDRSR